MELNSSEMRLLTGPLHHLLCMTVALYEMWMEVCQCKAFGIFF